MRRTVNAADFRKTQSAGGSFYTTTSHSTCMYMTCSEWLVEHALVSRVPFRVIVVNARALRLAWVYDFRDECPLEGRVK